MPEQQLWDTIVIGGSAAGLSAALTLGRARRTVLVVDSGLPRNRFAAHMHGVLGHEGLDPAQLISRGQREAAMYGAKFVSARVTEVAEATSENLRSMRITLEDDRAVFARTVIAATGLTDRLPEIPGLAERWGTSVLHCPYCHGWEVRGQRLGVLSNGPMSAHVGQLLRQWSDDLTFFSANAGELDEEVLHRLAARGVQVEPTPVTEVRGAGSSISDVLLADGRAVELDAIFAVATMTPNDSYLNGLNLERSETPMGSFLAVDPMFRTSHSQVWAAGNVANPGANVPLSISSGNFAGAAANAAMVEEDFDAAVAGAHSPSA
ncbi:NAD(P)/FAD-dependent oxidoreductase [Nesterenkonia flava]